MLSNSRSGHTGSSRCWTPSTRWFVDEGGTTTFAAVLSLVLTVVILATGVQWYWAGSSSCDIQSVADLGALAAADAIAKTVTVVQILDCILLSMNVVALVLHAVVVVSGVAVAASSPVGGAGMATLFSKAVEFDRKFIDVRKRVASEAYSLCRGLSDAAPYLAMGQSYRIIRENSSANTAFSGATYQGVAMPFPFTGEVSLSSSQTDERALLDLAEAANEENTADAERLKQLQQELEVARVACWDADVYRGSVATPYGWDPGSAIDDFERALTTLSRDIPTVVLPGSIGGSEWSNQVLDQQYREDYTELGRSVLSRFAGVAASRSGELPDPSDTTIDHLLGTEPGTQVFVVEHGAGERRAYHSSEMCSGLTGATAPLTIVAIDTLVGDGDHPPCSLCTPLHWAAIAAWQDELGGFVSAWNREAAALRAFFGIRREMAELESALSSRTGAAFDQLFEEASSLLKGGRLTYKPAGARGMVCVVVSTSKRRFPSFTIPKVTGADSRELGMQVALAGAALSPGGGESAVSQALAVASRDVGAGRTVSLSGAILSALGRSDGVSEAVVPLWRSGLDAVQGKASSLSGAFDGLPWGIGALMHQFLGRVAELAGVTRPDTRQFVPVLVSVSDVGDASAAGAEGQFVRAVQAARGAYGEVGESTDALKALDLVGRELYGSLVELPSDVREPAIMGKKVSIPFDDWSFNDGAMATSVVASPLGGFLGVVR